MSDVTQNLHNIEARIQSACDRSGRVRDDVRLLAVTKTKPIDLLREAYDAGYRAFGENKVQEILWKREELPADIEWHMIGHLQTNKVKQVVPHVAMIHSVDSVHLAAEISKRCIAIDKVMPVLVEVNVAGEESKFGVAPQDTEDFVRSIAVLPGITVAGLMTSAPYTENPESNRQYFRNLRELSIDIASKNIDNVNMYELSMGMTGDFEVAIEEGSTIVRIGTAIFGERNYSI